MFDYIVWDFSKSRDKFKENVRDERRDLVLEEFFYPLEEKIKFLKEVDEESDAQIKQIRNILCEAKSII